MKKKLVSRKLWLTIAAVIYTIVKSKPEYATLATSVYVIVQGYLDSLPE